MLPLPASLALPPQTPNPSPVTSEKDTVYAEMTGQVVWEGVPLCAGDKRPALSESGDVYTARWRGIIPIHYVDTTVRRPLMAITASLTRRERLPTAMPSPAADEDQPDQPGNENITLAKLNNADLLHGLAGEHSSSPKVIQALHSIPRTHRSTFASSKSDASSSFVLDRWPIRCYREHFGCYRRGNICSTIRGFQEIIPGAVVAQHRSPSPHAGNSDHQGYPVFTENALRRAQRRRDGTGGLRGPEGRSPDSGGEQTSVR